MYNKLILMALIASPYASFAKTRAEALSEATDRVNERYDVKEAKDVQKALDKLELKRVKAAQKARLLEVELKAVEKTVR